MISCVVLQQACNFRPSSETSNNIDIMASGWDAPGVVYRGCGPFFSSRVLRLRSNQAISESRSNGDMYGVLNLVGDGHHCVLPPIVPLGRQDDLDRCWRGKDASDGCTNWRCRDVEDGVERADRASPRSRGTT